MGDGQPRAQIGGQVGHGGRHDVRQHARALAAADDQQVQRPLPRRLKGGPGAVQHRLTHRIAGKGTLDAGGQFRGPDAAGDAMDARGEDRVHPPHHPVLFMDHARDAQGRGRRHRRNRRIAAKTHHHIRPLAPKRPPRGHDARRDAEGGGQLARDPAPRRGGRGHDLAPDGVGEGVGIAGAAIVGRQGDTPAMGQQHLGQRLRRKHVPTGPTGCDQGVSRHQRLRRITSAISPCARCRVSASSIPTAIPEAITDEPP